jgi:thiol-disulfide isomerase/thioredoxin
VWLLTAQPVYFGSSAAEALTPAAFETRVRAADAGGPAWVVLLYASWHPPCMHFAPAFGSLASAFATEGKLAFGAMDMARWPGLAERYGLDLNATSSQLPTVVLFEGGAEAERLPRKAAPRRASGAAAVTGAVVKGRWGRADLIHAFELDKRAGREGAAAAAAGKKRK